MLLWSIIDINKSFWGSCHAGCLWSIGLISNRTKLNWLKMYCLFLKKVLLNISFKWQCFDNKRIILSIWGKMSLVYKLIMQRNGFIFPMSINALQLINAHSSICLLSIIQSRWYIICLCCGKMKNMFCYTF